MQLERKFSRPAQWTKLALATVLMAAIFVSLFLSASPSLHEQLHQDAAQSSHQCAITVFQQQQLLVSNPSVIIVERVSGVLLPTVAANSTTISNDDYRFSASRAPPLLSPLA